MLKKITALLLGTSCLLTAILVKQPVVNNYQRITRTVTIQNLNRIMFGNLRGTISAKYRSSDEWMSVAADAQWDRLVYFKSYLYNGERTVDSNSLKIYEGSNEGRICHPGGICYDKRFDGYQTRYYFFVSMPDSQCINRYYYDESDEDIHYSNTISTGTKRPEAIAFLSGTSGDWLVYTDKYTHKVIITRLSGTTPVEEIVYTASALDGMKCPASLAIANYDETTVRIYVADSYKHRIISFLVKKPSGGSMYIVPLSEDFFYFNYNVYPTAIVTADYPPDFGLYVIDRNNGDVYLLSADIKSLIAKYSSNPTFRVPVHISFCGGEAAVSEQWGPNSGIQYFWLDCEVNHLRVGPARVSKGSYAWIDFNLAGPADSVVVTIKNSQGLTETTQIYGPRGIDNYNWPLYQIANLEPGSYKVIVKAEDPFLGEENYSTPPHSADTANFVVGAAYSTIGFEINEPVPFSNSLIFNNCCSGVTSQRIEAENTTYLLPHSGQWTFKFSGYDNSSDGEYDCVDCKLFENCGIAITKPTYMSCWIKATQAPGGADSLYVSLDGIISDQNYPWQQLKLWTKYGKPIDQNGNSIHSSCHPVPVDSQWHYYVFSLTPAAGDTIKILQFSYWGVPSEATGQFTVYLDDISISSDHPWNMWYGETFGNGTGSSHQYSDENFELGLSLEDEQGISCYGGARIIVDGNGPVSGNDPTWIIPTPSLRKDLHPTFQLNSNHQVSWMQYDKSHALILGFLIDGHWLYYAWNADNHWDEQGYVNMGDSGHVRVYNQWKTFTRSIYQDYIAEYGSAPQELQAYQIAHYCYSEDTGDMGGTVRGPVIFEGGKTPPGPNYNTPTVIRPNGGERWVGGKDHWYQHKVGSDLPKQIAVWWTDEYNLPSPTWRLIEIREFKPLSPPQYYTGIGVWHSPFTMYDKPNCAFKTQGLDMNGTPLSGQMDVSDHTFTLASMAIRIPPEMEEGITGIPQPPGSQPEIWWETDGICGVEGVDIYYTTHGGMEEQLLMSGAFMSGGDTIWHSIATGLAPGTYQAVDSIYDAYEDTTYYEYAYVGHYDNWTVPNTPTSGGNFKLVAHDTLGDSAVYIMPQTFNIPFGGAAQYSTAYTADKITTDENVAHLVYADNAGNILYSSNDDTYEWDPVDTVGQGVLPTLTLDDEGNPCAAWVTGTTNQQSIHFALKDQSSWSTPVAVAVANAQVARFSEPALTISDDDTLSMATFKTTGIMREGSPDFTAMGLLQIQFSASSPQYQATDTLWITQGSSLNPISSAPSYLMDHQRKGHYAFILADSTVYVQETGTFNRHEAICTASTVWPCLSATEGNVYLTYGATVSGTPCLIQRWKHPGDTFWRGQDTLYKGTISHIQSLGGALTLLEKQDGSLTRLAFDPVEHKVDTVHVVDSVSYGHGSLCYRTLDKGLPLIWTQHSNSSYYVATDWHDPDETVFPAYYLQGGGAVTPYTTHRDSTVSYGSISVDWGSDSLKYTLDKLDPIRNHTLLLEFYFDDDSIFNREYVVTTNATSDTVEVSSRWLKRMTIGVPAGDSILVVKIIADTGAVELSRLLLYQGEDTMGLMSSGVQGSGKQAIPYVLYQNFPNPFTTTTHIRFALPYNRRVSLKVYDVAGRLVTTLVDENKAPGIYDITWDGRDNHDVKLASGVYFINFTTDDFKQTKKAVFIK